MEALIRGWELRCTQYLAKVKIRNKNRQFINPLIVTSPPYRISGSLHIVHKLHSISKSYTRNYNLVYSKAKGHAVACTALACLADVGLVGHSPGPAVLTIFGLLVLCSSLTTQPWAVYISIVTTFGFFHEHQAEISKCLLNKAKNIAK